MRKIWTLPYAFTAPESFPEGFYMTNDGLFCTTPRNSRTVRRNEWICDPIHVRRITAGGNLAVSNQRHPTLRAIVAREMDVAEMAAALARIEVRVDQSCLRDVAEFFRVAEPWRSAWRMERAA